jgi:hypothetical protein
MLSKIDMFCRFIGCTWENSTWDGSGNSQGVNGSR